MCITEKIHQIMVSDLSFGYNTESNRECIKMLSNCGVRTAILTNGILASEDVIRRLYYSGLKSIQFSVDGSNAKSHDRLRNQQGVFEKVMKAIDTARKYDMEMSVQVIWG